MNKSQNQDNLASHAQKWPEEFWAAIDLFSLKSRFCDRLINATSDYLLATRSPAIDNQMPILTPSTMPLNRTKDVEKVIYISAIAFKLQKTLQKAQEKAQQKAPAEIAEAIGTLIEPSPDFTVHIRDGWIQFHLSEPGLATWLQRLSQWPSQTHGSENPHQSQNWQKIYATLDATNNLTNNLFLLEYTHARCCSLLRLGDREQLISLSESSLSEHSTDLQIINPNPIPWLSDRNQLRPIHLTERTLISQLITTLDTLSTCKSEIVTKLMVKLATDLSQDLLIFYAANPIWSKIKTENLALAQARLGLILTTQIVLKLLLEKGLGILPPQEM